MKNVDGEDEVEEQGLTGVGEVWHRRAPPPLQAR